MARPRAFDEQQVIDASLRVFWERGYEGTSIVDLQEATGLAKASLYGAFGDKEGLFVAAMEAYGRCFGRELGQRSETPVLSLLLAFVAVSRAYQGLGCFAVHSADELPILPDRARARVEDLLAQTDRIVADRVREGQEVGEIDPRRDPVEIAGLVTVFLRGLSPTARVGTSCDALEDLARALIALLAPRG